MRSRVFGAGMGVWSIALCVGVAAYAATAPVKVVATIFPLADLVRQIGREHVDVVTLLPPGASPHTFEPTPAQIRELAHAQLFVRVGAGLDTWVTKLLDARTEHITVVTATDGMQLLGRTDGGRGDPHIWLDPIVMRDHVVPALVEGLRHVDGEDAAAFERNAGELYAALSALDAEIRKTLAPLPSRNYVAFHSAWRYFGDRYGLHEVAVVEPSPGKEPSAQEIAALVGKARAARTRVILIESQFTPRIAQQIAQEFGGHVLLVDPVGGSGVAGRNTYVDLMRYNAQAFAQGLQ